MKSYRVCRNKCERKRWGVFKVATFSGEGGGGGGGQHKGYIFAISFLCDTRGLSKKSSRLMSHFVNLSLIL